MSPECLGVYLGSYWFDVQARYRVKGRSCTPQIRRVPQRHCADARNASTEPQRATGGADIGETKFRRVRAGRSPRLGGPEEYKRSTRSPGRGAWRWSTGMPPDSLSFPDDGLGKRLRPYFLNGFSDDHVKRYKKRPIYWLIISPKGTLPALIYPHRYNRDTVKRFPGGYLRPYQQKLEAKRVSAEPVLTGRKR